MNLGLLFETWWRSDDLLSHFNVLKKSENTYGANPNYTFQGKNIFFPSIFSISCYHLWAPIFTLENGQLAVGTCIVFKTLVLCLILMSCWLDFVLSQFKWLIIVVNTDRWGQECEQYWIVLNHLKASCKMLNSQLYLETP